MLNPEGRPSQRIIIPGLGLVTSLGPNVKTTWEKALMGESGIVELEPERITLPNGETTMVTIGGVARDFDPRPYFIGKDLRGIHRSVQMASVVAVEALDDSSLALLEHEYHKEPNRDDIPPYLTIPRLLIPGDRIGIEGASAVGGGTHSANIEAFLREKGERRLTNDSVNLVNNNRIQDVVSKLVGAKGPGITAAGACASGFAAIEIAVLRLLAGHADVMVAVGSDAILDRIGLSSFNQFRVLARNNNSDPTTATKPMSADKGGFAIGEGAGAVVLETLKHARKRGLKRAWGEIVGIGHTTYPDPDPLPDEEGIVITIRQALAMNKIDPDQVDLINAHSAGSAGDDREARAIKEVFGSNPRQPIGLTKSMFGHTMGTAPSLALGMTLLSMRDGILPPNLNVENPSEDAIGLDLLGGGNARPYTTKIALLNALGLGGKNIVLVVRALDPNEL